MLVSILAEDIREARERSDKCQIGREHLWWHPLAISLERQLGEGFFAVVTDSFVYLVSDPVKTNTTLVVQQPVDGPVRDFQNLWKADRAVPTVLNINIT